MIKHLLMRLPYVLAIMLTTLCLSPQAYAADGDEFIYQDLKYKVLSEEQHTVTVVSPKATYVSSLAIPPYATSDITGEDYTVTEISANAFKSNICTNIVLPESITKIGSGAFSGNKYLNKIVVSSTTPPTISTVRGAVSPFQDVPTDAIVYVPKGAKDKYVKAKGWTYFAKGCYQEIGNIEIELSASELTIELGDSVSLTANVKNDDDVKIKSALWNTSKYWIAHFDIGNMVKAYALGTTLFTYTIRDEFGRIFIAKCQVTVNDSTDENFISDNLTYQILSKEAHTASVTGYSEIPEEELVIPSSVKSNDIEYNVTEIGDNAFSNLGITSVSLPNTLTKIGYNAFRYCGLTSIDIPDSVTTIDDGAFFNCSLITSITIPNSVTTIGTAFPYCRSLPTIDIPASVASISQDAFFQCDNLTEISVNEANTIYTSVDGILYTKDLTKLLIAPAGKEGHIDIPNHTIEIGEGAFAYCKVNSVNIPNSVTTIGGYAFRTCSLSTVTIPGSVTNIGSAPFFDNRNLHEILVDESNNSYCSVDGVLFAKDMKSLIAFPMAKNASNRYDIPDTVEDIKEGAFYSCGLETITIPTSVKAIGAAAFQICQNLTSINIPYSVEKIGDYAFNYCHQLTSLDIPNSVTEIGEYAFTHLTAVTSVVMPESVTVLNEGVLGDCWSLTSIVIPSSVKEIGAWAIYDNMRRDTQRDVYVLASTPPTFNYHSIYFNSPYTIYIPSGSLNEYTSAKGWRDFTNFVEMGKLDISLSTSEIELAPEESETLTVSIDKAEEVTIESETWASSNPEVAAVENGTVKAIGEGRTTITYTLVDGYGCTHIKYCEVAVSEASGISGVIIDNDSTATEYYNLNGIRVNGDNLTPGIYIKRQGNKSTKIVVR